MSGDFLKNLVIFVEQEHKITEGEKLFNEFLNSKYPKHVIVKLVDHPEKGCYLKLKRPVPSYLESHLMLNIPGCTAKITEKLPLDANTLTKDIEEPFKIYLQELQEKNDPVYIAYQNRSKFIVEERKQMLNEDLRLRDKDKHVLTKAKPILFKQSSSAAKDPDTNTARNSYNDTTPYPKTWH